MEDNEVDNSLEEKTTEALADYHIIGTPEPAEVDEGEGKAEAQLEEEVETEVETGGNVIHYNYPTWRHSVPEKIIICLDISKELDQKPLKSKDGTMYGYLEVVKALLIKFLHLVSFEQDHLADDRMDQYALMLYHREAKVVCQPTTNIKSLILTINKITSSTLIECGDTCDLSRLQEEILHSLLKPDFLSTPYPEKPPYIVRCLLLYGRSLCIPEIGNQQLRSRLAASPYFFTDVFYLHGDLEDTQSQYMHQTILSALSALDDKDVSYLLSCGRDIIKLHNDMARFMGHVLQRAKINHQINK